jgi:multiple sugar transport system permease protein
MSLIGRVGRKRPRARLAMALLYLVLSLGAITTLYPFLLMLTTGLKGPTDQSDNAIVPKYLLDDKELTTKYVDDKYAGDKFNIASNSFVFESLAPELSPKVPMSSEIETYKNFLLQLPPDYWQAGFKTAPNQTTGRLAILYHDWLRKRYQSIEDLNKAYVEEDVGFQTVATPAELFELPDWKPNPGKKWAEWIEFKKSLPADFRIPVRTQWLFQKYLASTYKNQFANVPKWIVGSATAFTSINLWSTEGMSNANRVLTPDRRKLFEAFRAKTQSRFFDRPVEGQWMQFYRAGAWLPIAAADHSFVAAHESELRKEFAGRNYGYVLDYILLNGRAVWNTFLFCFLAILTQLTVNPIAAYALSRYPVRASAKILIFLLATMAFPAEVAMIPSFLLLKDLHLLNTFAALVLPGAASGYMIFLLKGFFDSLPQELFEAGSLDGAKEITMMTKIAFPMSKPVLGYLALLAFMSSYGAFIYAFLVAQDQRIWTLMVWIYQLQNSGAPKAVIMAALSLAAIPTLVVFLCAQRVIMRGIVLPGER